MPYGSSAQYDFNFSNTERVCLIEELHSKEMSWRWPDPYCENALERCQDLSQPFLPCSNCSGE